MTPCQELGYNVGDKFVMIKEVCTLRKGDIVSFVKQDRNEDLVLIERSDFRSSWCMVGEDVIPVNNWSSVEIKNCTVNHPSHYTSGNIECIDAIKASMTKEEFIGFLRGQIIKYIWRMHHKGNPTQDVGKSIWYANKLKETLEG